VRRIAEKVLARNNYRVVTADTLARAEAILEEDSDSFDLVFSDVVLPDGSGVDFCMRNRHKRPHLPVLLTSGYTGEKAQWEIITAEEIPFLQKPYSAAELLQAVARVF